MPLNKYESPFVQKTLNTLMLLAGNELRGLAPGEVAKSLNLPAADITRALNNLKYAGIAEQLPESSRWRLTTKIPQIAIAMLNNLDRAQIKLDETRQRYTREG